MQEACAMDRVQSVPQMQLTIVSRAQPFFATTRGTSAATCWLLGGMAQINQSFCVSNVAGAAGPV